jgi:hypothetical protein
MKAIILVTDSEAMLDFERVLVAEGHPGFTVMPAIAGAGRHGLKTGDRVHPGGSSLLLTVAEAPRADDLLGRLRTARDAAGHGHVTRMWTFDVAEAS